jgi:hypothetical protein
MQPAAGINAVYRWGIEIAGRSLRFFLITAPTAADTGQRIHKAERVEKLKRKKRSAYSGPQYRP